MQPLGLSTTQPLIGNQTAIKNASTNITGTSPSLLGASTPDTAMLFGTMLGLLGNTQASGNQVLVDPVSGFTYNPNPTASNPFLTPVASPNINLAELFKSLPTQFWNALLSMLLNPQAASANQPVVPLNADPTSTSATIAEPAVATVPPPPAKTSTAGTKKQGTGSNTKKPPKNDPPPPPPPSIRVAELAAGIRQPEQPPSDHQHLASNL